MASDWSDHYIDYKGLKKAIKQHHHACSAALDRDLGAPSSPLRSGDDAAHAERVTELAPAPPEPVVFAADTESIERSRAEQAAEFIDRESSNLYRAQETSKATFMRLLLAEVQRIESFYAAQVRRVPERLESLRQHVVPLTALRAEFNSTPVSSTQFKALKYRVRQMEAQLKREFLHAGVRLADLTEYVALNQAGFFKIAKKFDKKCLFPLATETVPGHRRALFPTWCNDHITTAAFATESRNLLERSDAELGDLFAQTFPGEQEELFQSISNTRAWKANPIMCGFATQHSRAAMALPVSTVPTLSELYGAPKMMWRHRERAASTISSADSAISGDEMPRTRTARSQSHLRSVSLKPSSCIAEGSDVSCHDEEVDGVAAAAAPAVCKKGPRMPRFRLWEYIVFGLAVLTVIIFGTVPIMDKEDRPAQRCLGILIAAALLWASEAVPLFVTALAIPVLVTTMSVLFDEDTDVLLTPEQAAKHVISHMMSSTILLVLTGFSIATAMSKYQLDQRVAVAVLKLAKGRPRVFLLLLMLMGALLSTFVSNVAAPVIILSLILPIIRTLPRKSSFTRALLLGNAMACNVGGMMSPISSPQNAVGVDVLSSHGYGVSFLLFIAVSLPVVLVLTVVIFCVITFWMFPPDVDSVPPISVQTGRMRREHWITIAISVIAIALWCAVSGLEPSLGSIGIISLVPMVLFYLTGVLSKADFEHSLPWAVVFLVMGGSILGKAVESSKLLDLVTDLFGGIANQNQWVFCFVMALFLGIVASLVSHTVSALIVLPIIAALAEPVGALVPVVFVSMFMCSGAAGLPVSSFPNVSTTSVVDEDGTAYISAKLIGKVGWLATGINLIGTSTIGYGLALLLPEHKP